MEAIEHQQKMSKFIVITVVVVVVVVAVVAGQSVEIEHQIIGKAT